MGIRTAFGLAELDWLRRLDLNQRPTGYEPVALPGCATPRQDVQKAAHSLLNREMCRKCTNSIGGSAPIQKSDAHDRSAYWLIRAEWTPLPGHGPPIAEIGQDQPPGTGATPIALQGLWVTDAMAQFPRRPTDQSVSYLTHKPLLCVRYDETCPGFVPSSAWGLYPGPSCKRVKGGKPRRA